MPSDTTMKGGHGAADMAGALAGVKVLDVSNFLSVEGPNLMQMRFVGSQACLVGLRRRLVRLIHE